MRFVVVIFALVAAALPASGQGQFFLEEPERGVLAETPRAEQATLERLLVAESWPRRAIAAVRLERYGCEASAHRLRRQLADPAWQVRAYAIRSLAHRREVIDPGWLAEEDNPRVVRTALRYRVALDPERVARGVHHLAASGDPFERMLAVEIGAASGQADLVELVTETCNTLILRMNRPLGGALSARLAWITGAPDQGSTHRWKRWRLKVGRAFALVPGHLIDDGAAALPLSLIASLDPERFAALEDYIQKLASRRVDLAICLDCTASMSGELQAAQGGIDDLLVFVEDVVREFRFGLVAYRDRRDRDFELKSWPFTRSLDVARTALWSLSAAGGGDTPEMVFDAMKAAYTELEWMPEHVKVLIVIGDAPPHSGTGSLCADMARRAAARGLVTHLIQTEERPVDHFPEIAEAGGGQCVELVDDGHLIAEIAGLTVGDTFSEELAQFFWMYLGLCR